MSVELLMLAYSTAVFLIIILAQAGLAIRQNGLVAQAGSRDNLPEPTVYVTDCKDLQRTFRRTW